MFGTKDTLHKRVKMFYTMEETKEVLSLTEDQIRALGKEGRLREFRDGPRLMYKGDQVEALLASGSYVPQTPLVLSETKKKSL